MALLANADVGLISKRIAKCIDSPDQRDALLTHIRDLFSAAVALQRRAEELRARDIETAPATSNEPNFTFDVNEAFERATDRRIRALRFVTTALFGSIALVMVVLHMLERLP